MFKITHTCKRVDTDVERKRLILGVTREDALAMFEKHPTKVV